MSQKDLNESYQVVSSGDIESSIYFEIDKEMGRKQSNPIREAVPGAEREAIIVDLWPANRKTDTRVSDILKHANL